MNGKMLVVAIATLGVIYLALLPVAASGYGYMGYHGYHAGPSFWYIGGPSIYYERGTRRGSVSGPRLRGGGPGAGK